MRLDRLIPIAFLQLTNDDADHAPPQAPDAAKQPTDSKPPPLDLKLAPSAPHAVPLPVLPTTTTAKVYVHNDSVVFDRPGGDDGTLVRPKVIDSKEFADGHANAAGGEGVVAAPEVPSGRDKVVFNRAPPGGSLAEVANNEGPGVRRLKQPDEPGESLAVGAAPKNDAAEADVNGLS